MYDSLKDKQVDDDLLEAEEIASIGYSKAQQLGKPKKKKESTFGKKPTVWNKKGKNLKPKIKRNDIVDDKYSKWLGTQPCVVTGIVADRGIGANNIHIHHIYSRNKGRNDYLSVPLMGYVHSWGNGAYHSNTKGDYIIKHKLMIEDIIEYFEDCASAFLQEYIEQGGVVNI
jgi:hypothetical protein